MNRREFLKCSGACAGASMAGVPVAGLAAAGQQQPPPPPPPLPGQAAPADPRSPQVLRPAYEFVVEIVEGKCQPHPTGQTLKYPEEKGKICPWLMDAMNGMIRVLEHGGTLPWMYAGTPYQKVVDPNGLTTEFVRCPDPSRIVVAKISRRRV